MTNISENDIAIIGMAGRFPKAENIQEYWENLRQGLDCIHHSDEEELLASGIPEAFLQDPRFVNASSNVDGAAYFDADFFSISNAEATLMDPQIRLLLQTSWQAIEDAGYDVDRLEVPVGNFCGMSTNSYLLKFLESSHLDEPADPLLYRILNDKDFLATWISYKLNLTGPAYSVQTACSTSLLAVHLACQSLLSYECDMALAGGATYDSDESLGYIHVPESIYSKDGRCRPFDKDASGTIMGDGVATVVLKRAADAVRDKDHIYALIKGTAVNNDGANKQGYTTPSVDCQRDVILEALALAAIDPESIGLLEAHGTGTLIGDPIEVAALTAAYRKYTGKKQYCALGSVKSNIGHLDAAAGIASLIKAALCVKEGRLVPSINFSEANPVLELEQSPFYVSREDCPWPTGFSVRRAGVSSLGVGGTNVHVLVEEPPVQEPASTPYGPSMVALSAASPEGLEAQKQGWAARLAAQPGAFNLPDLEFTSLYGRKAMPFRFCAVAGNPTQLIDQLRGENLEQTFNGTAADRADTVFLFPGQGSQFPNMAEGLYRADAAFRSDMDRCFEFLKARFDLNLKALLFESSNGQLHQTENTQVALFAVEYSLAQVLLRAGFRPQALIGHSIGEYVAACIAGCMDLEAALTLVYHRGRLMGSMPKGGMILIRQAAETIRPLLLDEVAICVYNADDNIVLGGKPEAMEQQKALLELNGIEFRQLRVSHAYHTEMMRAVLPEFREVLTGITLKPATLPIYSTYTGKALSADALCSPEYWLQQIVSPVQFAAAARAAIAAIPNPLFTEVGPGNGLSSFLRAIDPAVEAVSILSRSSNLDGDLGAVAKAKALLFTKGAALTLPEQHAGRRRPMPGYVFRKQYFWKPKKKVAYADFEEIKAGYHRGKERYRDSALRSTIEIQLRQPAGIPDALLDQLHQLHSRYLQSIKTLLKDSEALIDRLEVLYDEIPAASGLEDGVDMSNPNQKRSLNTPFVAPKSDTEKAVAAHWEQVLGYQPAGLLDDFFDVGGNSLLATQLINRINRELEIEISIAEVLSSSNVKNLVQIVEEKQWLSNSEELPNELII